MHFNYNQWLHFESLCFSKANQNFCPQPEKNEEEKEEQLISDLSSGHCLERTSFNFAFKVVTGGHCLCFNDLSFALVLNLVLRCHLVLFLECQPLLSPVSSSPPPKSGSQTPKWPAVSWNICILPVFTLNVRLNSLIDLFQQPFFCRHHHLRLSSSSPLNNFVSATSPLLSN